MTHDEHLFTYLGEECNEVAQRISKLLRFGADEVQPEQTLTNKERLMIELVELLTVASMCEERGLLPSPYSEGFIDIAKAKRLRVEKFINYAKQLGTITPEKQ